MEVAPKVQHFMWRLLKESLPIKAKLVRRGVVVSPLCPRYNTHRETMEHVFRDCNWTRRYWFLSPLGLRTIKQAHLPITTWLREVSQLMPKEEVAMFASLAYRIWTSRNKLCFEQKNYPLGSNNLEGYLSKLQLPKCFPRGNTSECGSTNSLTSKSMVPSYQM